MSPHNYSNKKGLPEQFSPIKGMMPVEPSASPALRFLLYVTSTIVKGCQKAERNLNFNI